MITCEACGRDFRTGRGLDCPYCGFNNARGAMPRTEASMRKIEKRRDREARRERREEE